MQTPPYWILQIQYTNIVFLHIQYINTVFAHLYPTHIVHLGAVMGVKSIQYYYSRATTLIIYSTSRLYSHITVVFFGRVLNMTRDLNLRSTIYTY